MTALIAFIIPGYKKSKMLKIGIQKVGMNMLIFALVQICQGRSVLQVQPARTVRLSLKIECSLVDRLHPNSMVIEINLFVFAGLQYASTGQWGIPKEPRWIFFTWIKLGNSSGINYLKHIFISSPYSLFLYDSSTSPEGSKTLRTKSTAIPLCIWMIDLS